MAWYSRDARDLPWRRTRDPYQVWVSEIMLQQTQVATVERYFAPFIKRFPTVTALAEAKEEDVLLVWEGLGYYRRARQMHRAARVIADEHEGEFPSDADTVHRLPGIGRYTAGAILSIAFDLPQPILEANTIRLHCRLLAYDGEPTRTAGQKLLWQSAEELLPRKEAGQFNQAVMELGATVCLPREPHCDRCPVSSLCPTRERGLQAKIPRPGARPVIEAVREAAVVVWRRNKVLLIRRPDGDRWAGLWDFPRFAVKAAGGKELAAELTRLLAAETGVAVELGDRLTTLKHSVTRFRITLDCFEARHRRGSPVAANVDGAVWVHPNQLGGYPLSVTGRKLSLLIAR